MHFDEAEQLIELVWLGLAANGLQIELFREVWVDQDVMATGRSIDLETQGLGESQRITEFDVLRLAGGQASEKPGGFHALHKLPFSA